MEAMEAGAVLLPGDKKAKEPRPGSPLQGACGAAAPNPSFFPLQSGYNYF